MSGRYTLLCGDAEATLRTLPDASVQCCVTSPPYFGLRDYGVAGQIGLEDTPDAFVARLVAVFRGVRRVLRDDGTLWINTTVAKGASAVNESYAVVLQVRMSERACLDHVVAITGMSRVQDEALPPSFAANGQRGVFTWKIAGDNAAAILAEIYPYLRLKQRQALAAWNLQHLKDGVVTKRGVPVPEANMEQRRLLHRVIRALNQREQTDIPDWCIKPAYHTEPGWYLRSDCIWSKPNPMPESVTDRPTKAHEYLFLLSKSERYYYDAAAIAEPAETSIRSITGRDGRETVPGRTGKGNHANGHMGGDGIRNKRSVWEVTTQPYAQAHFATYPPKLIEPCILAGSKRDDLVLDPFNGSGTTGMVALKHGRRYVGIDLNPEYIALAHARIGPVAAQGSLFDLEGVS